MDCNRYREEEEGDKDYIEKKKIYAQKIFCFWFRGCCTHTHTWTPPFTVCNLESPFLP